MPMRQLCALLLLLSGLAGAGAGQARWPRFLGPDGLGVAAEQPLPVRFGPSEKLQWKTPLPAGHSSPCVWDEHIFLTGFDGKKLETICLQRSDGKILWRRTAPAVKIEKYHATNSPASPTPAADGHGVYVYFGSYGLLCYDFAGTEQWKVPLPAPLTHWGSASSPIVAGDLVLLNCEQDAGSYLLAVERRTGKTVWKKERPMSRRGFSTPMVLHHDGVDLVLVANSLRLTAYDLKDGAERWTVWGFTHTISTSPAAGAGLIFVATWDYGGDPEHFNKLPPWKQVLATADKNKDGKLTADELPFPPGMMLFEKIDANKDGVITEEEWEGYRKFFAQSKNALMAIRPGGTGDVSQTHVAWKETRGLPHLPSPLCYKGRLYMVRGGGLFSCHDAKTGKKLYDQRLAATGGYSASPVAGDDKIYLTSENGTITVMQAGDNFKVLARNVLRERMLATPALADGSIYVRTEKALYAFGR